MPIAFKIWATVGFALVVFGIIVAARTGRKHNDSLMRVFLGCSLCWFAATAGGGLVKIWSL